ncbi:MAG: tetratricopeptide repeat protein [Maricaulaceae bacterium]
MSASFLLAAFAIVIGLGAITAWLTLSRRGDARKPAFAALALIPLLTLGIYALTGSPEQAHRFVTPPETSRTLARSAALAELDARRAQLEAEGGSLADWRDLGLANREAGRLDAAISAFAAALTAAEDADADARLDVLGAYGEARVNQRGGVVDREAASAFGELIRARPDDPGAVFFLGLAARQAGDPASAVLFWRRLLALTPPDLPGRDRIAQALAEAEAALETPDAVGLPAPDADAARAVAELSAEDQRAFIADRVASFRARVEAESPEDPTAWVQLARMYVVLERREDALSAFDRALALRPDPDIEAERDAAAG